MIIAAKRTMCFGWYVEQHINDAVAKLITDDLAEYVGLEMQEVRDITMHIDVMILEGLEDECTSSEKRE